MHSTPTDLLARVPLVPGQEVLDVGWMDADEALPFDDESFDVVRSAFGVQFASRHYIAADELIRVCRPDGRIGLVNWTPESLVGQFFRILSRHLPAAPHYGSPPPLWGTEDHIRSLFVGAGLQWRFSRGRSPWRFTSVEAWATFMESGYGPALKARERIAAVGRWEECRQEIVALAERLNAARDGSLLIEAEYLVAVGTRGSAPQGSRRVAAGRHWDLLAA